MADYPTDEVYRLQGYEHVGALVNQNSGERSAAIFVFDELGNILGKDMVFNLFPEKGKPPAIEEAKAFIKEKKPDLLIVAGGDGTVSLGLDITDAMRDSGDIVGDDCPIASLPMGTANDLSRSLGFGGGYVKPVTDAKQKFANLISRIMTAQPKRLDRFKVDVSHVPSEDHLHETSSHADAADLDKARTAESFMHDNMSPQERLDRAEEKPIYSKFFMNYFSVGFDAEIANSFGKFRDENPKACTSRTVNKMWYGCFGCQAMVKADNFPKKRVSLVVDGKATPIPSGIKALIFGNMLTYAGGSKLWRDDKDDDRFTPIAVDDKKVEITGLTGVWHLVGVGTKTRQALKVGQGTTIELLIPANFTMQYDGEPLAAPGSKDEDVKIAIKHVRQSLVCELPDGVIFSADDPIPLHAEEVVERR